MSLASIRASDPMAAWCIARTMPLEGGLVDNPHDPGGITNLGVSLRFALLEVKANPEAVRWFDLDHDGKADRKDIAGLTPDAAADIFNHFIWSTGFYGRLAPALVAWKCFDIAVNTGPNRAALLLQKALCDAGSNIPVDAQVGKITIDAVKAQASNDNGLKLIAALRKEQADFYKHLVDVNPDFAQFRDGWLHRAAA